MLLGGFARQFTRQPLIEDVPIISPDCRDSRVYENSIRIGRGVEIGMYVINLCSTHMGRYEVRLEVR